MASHAWIKYIDGLEKERRNSSAFAVELRLSYTHPSISCSIGPGLPTLYNEKSVFTLFLFPAT